jgi:cysteine desulfurase
MTAYLDHASAWPLPDAVQQEMARWAAHVGSPMALHEQARAPADAVGHARDALAALMGWAPESVIFTSGATEARNLAIKGVLAAARADEPVIVADPLAHASTLAAARSATRHGGDLLLAGVDCQGRVDAHELQGLADGADIVVITHGQAEVGTIRDAAHEVAAIRDAAPDAVVVLDADETAGLLPLADGLGADLVVVGGRTLGAPSWVGALMVRPGTRLHPLIEGGLEEGGKRGGPHDVPGIAALGLAARDAREHMAGRVAHMRAAGVVLAEGMLAVPGTRLNGPPVDTDERLPGHVQVSARGVEGEAVALAMAARGVAVSPGSACTFGAGKASPVLEAMGLDDEAARSAVLVTAGPGTTHGEVQEAVSAYAQSVEALRAMAPS